MPHPNTHYPFLRKVLRNLINLMSSIFYARKSGNLLKGSSGALQVQLQQDLEVEKELHQKTKAAWDVTGQWAVEVWTCRILETPTPKPINPG